MLKSEDITKLHAESLQLRNQQFQIVTLALASTGISAWLIPAISSGENKLPDILIFGSTVSWLFLLLIFFAWSLSLKRLIDIISRYLRLRNDSEWEIHYSAYNKQTKLTPKQTRFSLWIFYLYGSIVTISGLL